ncbi:MAG: serine/threonine protein kinase [Verrucomicrobiaceae bacterium]|nr:serine/threonine protein kinase [Verrucomicrobiaceae bacterium]
MAILSEGQTIRDTYEVERFLGEGAFAEVYRVKHRFLGRQAMKVFKAAGMTLGDIEEMLGEAIMLSKIGHPNIVRVFDANTLETDRGLFGYFTMENVPGGSLEKFWQSHGTKFVPLETTIDLMKQVCRGLTVAHRSDPPVIHRDIKPQNILVGYEVDGLRARVSDFGLAKSVNPLTLLATAAGTLTFKAPEAFSETKGDSCAGDVWALGTTLYLLLTDRLPYEMPHDLGWGSQDLFQQKVRPASEFNADVNRALDDILQKTLAIKVEDRYRDARELLNALESWRPGSDHVPVKQLPPDVSKTALGSAISTPNEQLAKQKAQQALDLKKEGRLADAADLMEEAFNKWPDLRDKYAGQVRLWRCGITM